MSELKYGLLPGHIPVGLKFLPHYVAGSLPKAPPRVAVPSNVTWGMDGNDVYGDCGVAGINHGFMAVDAILNYPESVPADSDIINYYLTYTGGQDTGVVLADFLAYVKAKSFFGHTIAGYAPVAVHDVPTLLFAINAFDFAYCGIAVTKAMMQAFTDNKPWTLDDMLSPVDGGHCVPLIGYDSTYLYCVTWGRVQAIAYSAWHQMSSEAWAVITGEFAARNGDGRGINLAALQADLPQLNS